MKASKLRRGLTDERDGLACEAQPASKSQIFAPAAGAPEPSDVLEAEEDDEDDFLWRGGAGLGERFLRCFEFLHRFEEAYSAPY